MKNVLKTMIIISLVFIVAFFINQSFKKDGLLDLLSLALLLLTIVIFIYQEIIIPKRRRRY